MRQGLRFPTHTFIWFRNEKKGKHSYFPLDSAKNAFFSCENATKIRHFFGRLATSNGRGVARNCPKTPHIYHSMRQGLCFQTHTFRGFSNKKKWIYAYFSLNMPKMSVFWCRKLPKIVKNRPFSARQANSNGRGVAGNGPKMVPIISIEKWRSQLSFDILVAFRNKIEAF